MGHNKGSPKRKVLAMSSCFKRTERSQINDLMIHLKPLEKQEKAKPILNRREIYKNKAQN
jgi:ribosomal protein L35AE/L33A